MLQIIINSWCLIWNKSCTPFLLVLSAAFNTVDHCIIRQHPMIQWSTVSIVVPSPRMFSPVVGVVPNRPYPIGALWRTVNSTSQDLVRSASGFRVGATTYHVLQSGHWSRHPHRRSTSQLCRWHATSLLLHAAGKCYTEVGCYCTHGRHRILDDSK